MRELLSASSQRMINILEALSVRKGWSTFAELSEAVQASERTVAEDISYLRRHWGQILNIECSKKNGVRLLNQNTASIGLVFNDLFNDSVALRWLKELLFHPNNPAEFYESRLYVSRSTLIRLLPKINRCLAQRGLAIQCRNNRYQFLGENEYYLRDFSASFLLELYGLDLQKYDLTLDLTLVKDLILSAFTKHLPPRELAWILDDDISIVYQIMVYLVALVREEHGYRIPSDYPVEEEIAGLNWTDLQKHFPHINADNLRPIHQFFFDQFHGWHSDAEQTLVSNEAERFLQRIFSVIPVSPGQDGRYLLRFVIKSLYLNAKLRPFKTSALFDRIYYFSLSMQLTNPLLYQVIEENLKTFSRRVKLDMSTKAADILFWMCLTCPELYQFTQSKTALLIDDFGRPHARFLAKILSDFFNKHNTDLLRIDIAPYPNVLTSPEFAGYDIIITTIPNLPVSHRHVLLISDYPDYESLYKIYRILSLPPVNNLTHYEKGQAF
ncbi:helix-turn-helix domain-containing protein [Desulfitobacterium hafniense]|uniref:helix-turn-helix domain-containing protein n=1 Tax=Desulfitobacterium hafniense TaxID=49338 RepID=UPI000381DF34|nr:helix-turn-helix domain-containing protein [Desulfitobacterium hafniense]